MKDDNKQQSIQRVAIYIRVSTDEQVEKYGRSLQETAIHALIKSRSTLDNKLVFAGEQYIYFDDGVSGETPLEERPAFTRLQEDIANSPPDNKPFDSVAVYKIDRFARKLKILLDVIDFFDDYNIKFLSVNESIDTSTPFGKAMLGIIGVIAELELETIKQRTQGGREEAAKTGVIMGNTSMFGYKKNAAKRAEILEEESMTVVLIFNWFVNGKINSGQIARKLEEMKILSPEESAIYYGKRAGDSKKVNNPHHWTTTAVLRILSDEIYLGKYYYNKKRKGKILPKDQWTLSPYLLPQIIDEITFEKARLILEQSKHERPLSPTNHIYLLSGLMTCDACYSQERDLSRRHWIGSGKKLKNGNQTYYYNCGRKNITKYDRSGICPTLPLPASEIEKYIIEFTKKLLKSPISVFEYQNRLKSTLKGIEHLRKDEGLYIKLIGGIPARINNLRYQHEHGHLSSEGLEKRVEEANKELKRYQEDLYRIRRNLAEISLSKGYSETLELFAKRYSPALDDTYKDRREIYNIIHALIEEIIVYSRPLNEKDVVAGMHKEKQLIPERLHIKLKLPQEIIRELNGSWYENASGGR